MRVNSETVTLTRTDVIMLSRHLTLNSAMTPAEWSLASALINLGKAFKGKPIDPPQDGNSRG